MGSAKVQVLLSTHNGQKYLTELIDSVLNQDYPELDIFVRDDGSNDGTQLVLEKYSGLNNVQILHGDNAGVVGSFFTLLNLSSPDVEYIAFCDQDDVWEKDKVSRAINILEKNYSNEPLMYCSRVTLADENLKVIGFSQIPCRELSFANALAQNIATGCTMIINNAARRLILKRVPKAAMMHDWWIYQVVSAFGKVIYDAESRILYRQHSANLIGSNSSLTAKWIRRAGRLLEYGMVPFVTAQAMEFGKIYGESLPMDKKNILDRFVYGRSTLLNRLSYAFRGEAYCQTIIDNIIFRVLIILNRI